MRYHLEVISTGQSYPHDDKKINICTSSFSINLPHENILFNCPENLQRLNAENKNIKLSKVKNIFFTEINSSQS